MLTSNIGVKEQAVNLYKLVLFESSHPVFCYYMTVFSCYNKARATFAWKLLKLCGIPAIQRRYSDSDSVSDKGMRVKRAVWEERARRGMSCVYTVDTVENEYWNHVRYFFIGIKIRSALHLLQRRPFPVQISGLVLVRLRLDIFIHYWSAIKSLNINSNWAYTITNNNLKVTK